MPKHATPAHTERSLGGYGGGGGGAGPSQGVRNVFISFHMEDEAQVHLLRAQARNDNFDLEFNDYSVKEPFDDHWRQQCAERISRTSVVIVMIGTETYDRP